MSMSMSNVKLYSAFS